MAIFMPRHRMNNNSLVTGVGCSFACRLDYVCVSVCLSVCLPLLDRLLEETDAVIDFLILQQMKQREVYRLERHVTTTVTRRFITRHYVGIYTYLYAHMPIPVCILNIHKCTCVYVRWCIPALHGTVIVVVVAVVVVEVLTCMMNEGWRWSLPHSTL